MLSSLRSASKGWVSKILLLLLVLSFAVWGIADQLGGNFAGDAVVEAGETKVSTTDFRLAYNRQLDALSQQLGQRVTNEQARLFGIDRQVISQLIGGAVLDEQAREMQLGLSEDRLAGIIAEQQPQFVGMSRQQISAQLARAGIRDIDYINSLKQAATRQQVMEAVNDGMKVPDIFLDAVAQFSGQTRDVSFVEIDESTLAEIAQPDEATLAAFFEENLADYRAPEYRAIQIVRLTPDVILDEDAITDADVRAEYEDNRARYATAEKRTVQQLVFSSEDDAKSARERILAGGSFEAEVEAAGRTMSDVTLGSFEKANAPDAALGDAAFALSSTSDISPVVEGAFGSRLIRVSEIVPEQVQPFEEASIEIRKALAMLEAQDILLDIHDGYEDARAAGNTMEEAAKAQKLDVLTIGAIDRQGLDQSGNPVDLGDEANDIIRGVFSADVNVENPPIGAGRDGFIWYEVTNIIEDRDRTLDEVEPRVRADWIEAQKNEQLDAAAERVSEALRSGRSAADLAAENSYRADNKFGLSRQDNDSDFGQAGVLEVFSVGPKGVGIANGATGNRRLVFRVETVSNPLADGESLPEQQARSIEIGVRNDLLDQMINRLQLEFPVRINQAAIEYATTAYNSSQR